MGYSLTVLWFYNVRVSKLCCEFCPTPQILSSELALNFLKRLPISATVPASKLQTAALRRALFCPHICHLLGLNLICDYKVMRLTFKQIAGLMNPDECWPSKMSPWEAGHILTPMRLPPQTTMTGISLWKLPAGTISQLQKIIENQSHLSMPLIALKCSSLFNVSASPGSLYLPPRHVSFIYLCIPQAVHRGCTQEALHKCLVNKQWAPH